MEILQENKNNSTLWSVMGIAIFLLCLASTYAFHLSGNGSADGNQEYEEVYNNFVSDTTFWEVEKSNWLAQQKKLENKINECLESGGEDSGLKSCQEKLESVKSKIDRHDAYLDDLEIKIVSLTAKIKACRASKN